MRLIDADVLLEFIKKKYHDIVAGGYPYNIVAYDLTRVVEKQPVIDAVPVVRCKDCIHAVDITNRRYVARFGDHAKNCTRCRGDSGFGYYDLSVVYPDGFCDEGEKRND